MIRMIALTLGLLVLPTLSPSRTPECIETGETSIVRLKFMFTMNADNLGTGKVALFQSESTGRDYASRFRDNTAAGIPYGLYRLRAHSEGFQSAERLVLINEPTSWVALGLHLGVECGPFHSRLDGKIEGLPKGDEPIWVRLISVRSSVLKDTLVQPSGAFSIAGVAQDSYVLVVWSGDRVLATKTVEIGMSEKLHIVL